MSPASLNTPMSSLEIIAEMWLLPNWFPFHPGRLWCHCRMVYLPMGYLYGSRFIYSHAETDPLISELREEVWNCLYVLTYITILTGNVPTIFLLLKRLVRPKLYCEPYDSIQWDSTRHLVADMDNYSPIPAFMKFAQNCLSFYENWTAFRPFRDAVRKAGLKFCLEYMKAEDLQTNYVDIGPVNKALNMVSAFYGTSSSEWRW
jgi:squalene cyclase